MDQSLKLDTNKGEIVKVACRRCDAVTNHKVLCSVEVHWEEIDICIEGIDRFEIIECFGCNAISFRAISSNSEDQDVDEKGNLIFPEKEGLYPNRIAGRKPIENSFLLPQNVLGIYQETHGALCSQFNILTGVGVRALIESVCREKNAEGRNLEDKINDLVEKGILSKNNAGILHKTRLLGNRSAHEFIELKAEELDVVMDIIENLLENVYVIPERAKRLKVGIEMDEGKKC